MICGYCRRGIVTEVKYWFEEKFVDKKSDKQIPFCNAECSTKWVERLSFYRFTEKHKDNGYI